MTNSFAYLKQNKNHRFSIQNVFIKIYGRVNASYFFLYKYIIYECVTGIFVHKTNDVIDNIIMTREGFKSFLD